MRMNEAEEDTHLAVLGSQIRLYGNPHSQGSATKSQVFGDLCDCCQFEPLLQFLLCDDPEVTKAMHLLLFIPALSQSSLGQGRQ